MRKAWDSSSPRGCWQQEQAIYYPSRDRPGAVRRRPLPDGRGSERVSQYSWCRYRLSISSPDFRRTQLFLIRTQAANRKMTMRQVARLRTQGGWENEDGQAA